MSGKKGFVFKLQPVLDHRQNLVDEAEKLLGEREREVAERQQGLDMLAARRQDMRVYLGALQVQPSLDIQTIEAVNSYNQALGKEERALRAGLLEAERRAREAREAVVERRIDLEVIEKLRERDLKRYHAEQRAKEERMLDDLASAAFARGMGAERGLRPTGDAPWNEQGSTSPMSHSNW
jgi:flagellar export protein FliJ